MAARDERINDSMSRSPITPSSHPSEKAKKSPQFFASPILPHELIVEILSWLPVRSLIRFRCVSKSFRSLISDPQFIQAHLRKIKYLTEMRPNFYRRVALTYFELGNDRKFCYSCSLDSLINDSVTDSNELDQLSYKDNDGIKHRLPFLLVGSCDGLICSYVVPFDGQTNHFFVLWNPSTRFVYNIPNLDFEFEPLNVTAFGFGYDGEMNDYKVVVMLNFENIGATVPNENRVVIFSQRTKCWRTIEGFRYVMPESEFIKHRGTYVNGTLCWPMESESNLSWIIVCFDLAKETFNEVPQPQPNYGDLGYINRYLGVLDGCLSCTYFNTSHSDIWVMKDFGVEESWTKLVRVPYSNVAHIEPLYVTDSGEILLMFNWRVFTLTIYNYKDGTIRTPTINGVTGVDEAVTYFESLFSPEVDNEL